LPSCIDLQERWFFELWIIKNIIIIIIIKFMKCYCEYIMYIS
jgi:hypothetical protein